MNRATIAGFVFLILVFGSLITLKSPSESIIDEGKRESYRLFRIENESCNFYYRECQCDGEILTMESYPPQYNCRGEETCKDIQEVECK